MKTLKILVPVAAALMLSSQATAQTPEEEEVRREAEARRAEVRVQQAEARERMIEAERQLAEAARRVAELSSQNLPRRVASVKRLEFDFGDKPRLGVTIGGNSDEGPVEGVAILGVTPGSAAEDAGLRAGDIITSINSESLSADTTTEAQERLLDFMRGVEEGDVLDVEYLRDGNVGKVEVEPRVVEGGAYAFAGVPGFPVPEVHVAPEVAREFQFVMPFVGNSWGDMELVELNEGLGRYFGTDTGLLVINAPQSEAFKLEDGDVIQSIDGREPTSVGHALRILASYQAGEQLELKIMRDKRRQTLNIEMPDDRTSFVAPEPPAPRAPVRAVAPPKPVREERT